MRRRELLKGTGLAAIPSSAFAGQSSRASANDRVSIGVIGCGGQGTSDLRAFLVQPDVDVVAVCDVYQPNMQQARQLSGGKAEVYKDYRQLLENKNVQAVLIATPEHWHALMCIDACNAGKDVYVEKPASHNIRDGRLMVDAARRNNRIVQVGSQQRSGAHFKRAVKYVQEGRIGDVHFVTCWNHSGNSGFVDPQVPPSPPADLDYEMWLGPAQRAPFTKVWPRLRRNFWNFYGGSLTEWGAHLADIAFWAMKVDAPQSVVANGANYRNKQSELPDTLQVMYEFPNFLFQYSVLQHNSFGPNGENGAKRFGSQGTQFHGTKGTLFVDRRGFKITPQYVRHEDPANVPPLSGFRHDDREPNVYYTAECLPEESDTSVQLVAHIRNFVDCVKNRNRPNADIEDGHRTNTACRLGNISYRVKRKLRWDGVKEQVIDDPEANRLVVGTYREPWIPKGLEG